MLSSHLVETVMINVDDFSDNFLTCGTCFSGYDTSERAAKLLPCSHTICRSCLDRILSTELQSGVFRCPICRENVTIPSGGAGSFPPAFIVNQLLDLLATQRRDVVPKCRIHPNQELLFCETCDIVFCSECRGRNHSTQPYRTTTPNLEHDSLTNDTADNMGTTTLNSNGNLDNTNESMKVNASLNHNVITFNVALKRCSEIMFYKMNLCIQELNSAQQAVSSELERLDTNTNVCVQSINSRFTEILALVERRQSELLDTVKRLGEEKRRALTDQLSLIETERDLIRHECSRLKGVLNVRSITKAISYLNDKLDTISGLTEPRENAFLRYQDCIGMTSHPSQTQANICDSSLTTTKSSSSPLRNLELRRSDNSNSLSTGSRSVCCAGQSLSTCISSSCSSPSSTSNIVSLLDIARCLAGFGGLVVSTTYPALCTARLPNEVVVHLNSEAVIQVVDYHGRPQLTGGTDPMEVLLTDPQGHVTSTDLTDLNNGTYILNMLTSVPGTHVLSVHILNRPIRGSPFSLNVKSTQKRMWTVKDGSDGRGLIQPFAVAFGPYPNNSESHSSLESAYASDEITSSNNFIYVLDTGNSRMLVLNPENGSLHTTLIGEALSGQAATGMVWSPLGLWIVNWRAKQIFLLDPTIDQVTSTISSSLFKEPTSITRCPVTDRIFVADNGAGCIFLCDPVTGSVDTYIGTNKENLLDSPDRRKSSDSPNYMKLERNSKAASSQAKVCRRVSGLCVSDTGELIVSTGSSIRIYTTNGQHLTDLHFPSQLVTEENSMSRFSTLRSRASLDVSRYDTDSPDGTLALRNPRIHLDTLTSNHNSHSDRLSLSESRPSSGTLCRSTNPSTSRGQFGGVVLGRISKSALTSCKDKLGTCILATYSDRKRSGIVVWPEVVWTTYCKHSRQLPTSDNFNSSISVNHDYINLSLETLETKPYLVEVDPPFRRLAGLISLPDSRDLIVVDQAAQNVQRIRYA